MQWSESYDPSTNGDLINLAQGVPGAPPPARVLELLAQSSSDPSTTRYGDLRGDSGLREEFCKDVNTVYGADVDSDAENVITSGANLAFAVTVLGLAKTGEEIILPTPWYFNNEMQMTMLGIKTVPLVCQAPTFQPDPSTCRRLITNKTRAIVLVSPNNPTGAIYSHELLQEFAALAKEFKIALVLDETYRDFLPEGYRPHDLFSDPSWRQYLIQLFSFSKVCLGNVDKCSLAALEQTNRSYAIPGHRLGSIIGPQPFMQQLHKALDCFQICPARPAQRVLEWSISNTRQWREATRDEILIRQRVFKDVIANECRETGWKVCVGGGYFAYVMHPFERVSSEEVAKELASKVGVVVLPGTFFSPGFEDVDQDRYLRFSIANVDVDTLRKVPSRLNKLVEMWSSL
ncbi:hypothetical protein OIV83_002346 [Microbotryomycetes sp. JL201]|nr:hypothetical protein OIV83_002346 [Microbotryomycetes sp. JL201]